MDEFMESTPLSGRSKLSPPKQALFIFGAILLFAFLAFVFSTASFAATKSLHTGVNNNFYDNQGGLIKQTYPISSKAQTFQTGTILSFCDGDASSVCPGLGPRWNQTLYPVSSFAPAIAGSLVQLTADLAVYAWVSNSDPSILRVAAIRTSTDPPAYTSGNAVTISLNDPIDFLVLKAFNENSFVVSYDIHNSSYLIAGTVTPTTQPTLGQAVKLLDIPVTLDDFETDVLVLQNKYILVSSGQNSVGASFLGFTLSGLSLSPITITKNGFGVQITNDIASLDLGTNAGLNYLFIASGSVAAIGTWTFSNNVLTLSPLRAITFSDVLYETLGAENLFNGYIALFGVQTANLGDPLTISMVLQWSTVTPYLTSFSPSNLLETQDHQLLMFQLSSCYAPSTNPSEPQGELFFTYVDSLSDKAKLIRAKITATSSTEVQLLPSLPIDISTFTYAQFGPTMAPLLSCPSSAGVLLAYQYLGTFMNTFVWEGGYRFAGIVQEDYHGPGTKKEVTVVRQGISAVHQNLQPGYSYYLTNGGHLRPHLSLTELFTPSSHSTRLGVAISDSELLLDPNVFEVMTRGERDN